MISKNLNTNEYNIYYKPYIDLASSSDIIEGLKQNLASVLEFYSELPKAKHNYAYADGKWTIKDILLHIIDTERIFTYRALRVAREDKTPLAGFDQDNYVISSQSLLRPLEDILEEYKAVRNATIALYSSFDTEALQRIGEASGSPISVRAIGYILTGHENHHNQVIKERYL